MSIESITNRILKEARDYAASKKAEAEAVKKAAVDEASGKVEGILAAAGTRAENDAALLISRRESVADLDARKMQLAAKQEVIEDSFAKALDKLQNIDVKDYVSLIISQLGDYKNGTGEILLNKADLEKVGAALKKELKGTNLTVSDETADIKGGFILKQGNVSYNSSLEMLLEDKKAEMTAAIAAELFDN